MNTHTRIKFCGLVREADVDAAVALGVDMIGLVFAERSPRRVEPEHAARLRARIPAHIQTVALVMDTPADAIAHILRCVKPDLLQFHGSENDAFCTAFGLPYLKAIAMGQGAQGSLSSRMAAFPSAHAFVLDGHGVGEAGGSGQCFDWHSLPSTIPPFLLAGGLHENNVAQAIQIAKPWGVDVSSGIETTPGQKDPTRMARFVAAARGMGRGE